LEYIGSCFIEWESVGDKILLKVARMGVNSARGRSGHSIKYNSIKVKCKFIVFICL